MFESVIMGDKEAMERVFEGIDRVLFVSGAPGNRQKEHAKCGLKQQIKSRSILHCLYKFC